MGQDVSREINEVNIDRMIVRLRELQQKKQNECVDSNGEIQGTTDDFNFSVDCLEKLKKADKAEKLPSTQNEHQKDLAELAEKFAEITNYNTKRLTDLREKHQLEIKDLKDQLIGKTERIQELEEQVKELKSAKACSCSTKTVPEVITKDLHSKLLQKQQKVQQFQAYLTEMNKKTLEMVYGQFQSEVEDLGRYASEILVLTQKLEEKTQENQELVEKSESLEFSKDLGQRIEENVIETLLEKGILMENALKAVHEAKKRCPNQKFDEELLSREAMKVLLCKEEKEHVLKLKSKKTEEKEVGVLHPFDSLTPTDFVSSSVLLEHIHPAHIQEAFDMTKRIHNVVETDSLDDNRFTFEELLLEFVNRTVLNNIGDYTFCPKKVEFLIEEARLRRNMKELFEGRRFTRNNISAQLERLNKMKNDLEIHEPRSPVELRASSSGSSGSDWSKVDEESEDDW